MIEDLHIHLQKISEGSRPMFWIKNFDAKSHYRDSVIKHRSDIPHGLSFIFVTTHKPLSNHISNMWNNCNNINLGALSQLNRKVCQEIAH